MDLLVNYGIKSSSQETSIKYINATGGTTLEYNLDGKRYRSHTFTSSGNFVVTTAGNGDRNQVDYLIIAGGASGGSWFHAGGGGAGGFVTTITPTPQNTPVNSKLIVSSQSYPVIVGAGGAARGTGSHQVGNKGVNSSFANIIAMGGGGGGLCCGGYETDQDGGSGGGGPGAFNIDNWPNKGFGISGQGNDGGNGGILTSNTEQGGGGGGAGQVGEDRISSKAGNGGNGLANLLRTGSNETRAGGGGGGARTTGRRGFGGSGGGGIGGGGSSAGGAGTGNTGSGGGGSGQGTVSGAGGSGIVIIRYEIAPN